MQPVKDGRSALIASAVGRSVAARDDTALGIVGVAFLAPANRESIQFATVHHERNGLGGFAKRDRQRAGREWVERTGMARASRGEQPLHYAHRVRRCHADWLVEHDPAMHVVLVALFLLRLRCVPILRRTQSARTIGGWERPHASRRRLRRRLGMTSIEVF